MAHEKTCGVIGEIIGARREGRAATIIDARREGRAATIIDARREGRAATIGGYRRKRPLPFPPKLLNGCRSAGAQTGLDCGDGRSSRGRGARGRAGRRSAVDGGHLWGSDEADCAAIPGKTFVGHCPGGENTSPRWETHLLAAIFARIWLRIADENAVLTVARFAATDDQKEKKGQTDELWEGSKRIIFCKVCG
uniref:Uncharacterized protein n=1 Tax=Globodera rostochiensis TaxID=31243 RepID=A0A914H3W2_GLORO